MNAAEHLQYLADRRAATPLDSLRRTLYEREGVEATDDAISRNLHAWAVERQTGSPGYRQRQTAIVFGRCASDACRRAAAPGRLGEETACDVTRAAPIVGGWDEPVRWPDFAVAA
jgi:hypothetical protein